MSVEFDFLTPDDKPALLGLSTPELQDTAKTALDQLGYKVHLAANHGEFLHKFAQVPYHLVILEELFSAATPEENACVGKTGSREISCGLPGIPLPIIMVVALFCR